MVFLGHWLFLGHWRSLGPQFGAVRVGCTLIDMRVPPIPSSVLTDSMCSLQLIRSWASRSELQILSCFERDEIQQFLYQWQDSPNPPTLEKAKAHDEARKNRGNARSWG